MQISISNSLLAAFIRLVSNVVTESNLSITVKSQFINYSKDFESGLRTNQITDFLTSNHCDEKNEVQIKFNEQKLLDLINLFNKHRALFVGLFNIIVHVVISIDVFKTMFKSLPARFGYTVEVLNSDIEEIRKR